MTDLQYMTALAQPGDALNMANALWHGFALDAFRRGRLSRKEAKAALYRAPRSRDALDRLLRRTALERLDQPPL
jgi:hypothetical protein